MNTIKIFFFSILIFLGGCMFVYGGYDDSPGGQLLGLAMGVIGAARLFRTRKSSDLEG